MRDVKNVLTVITLAAAMAFAGASIVSAQGTNTPSTAGNGKIAPTAMPAAGNYKSGNPNTQGATGQSVVPGNNSTMSGDSSASAKQKTSGTGGGAK